MERFLFVPSHPAGDHEGARDSPCALSLQDFDHGAVGEAPFAVGLDESAFEFARLGELAACAVHALQAGGDGADGVPGRGEARLEIDERQREAFAAAFEREGALRDLLPRVGAAELV